MDFVTVTVYHMRGTTFDVWETFRLAHNLTIEVRQIAKVNDTTTQLKGPLHFDLLLEQVGDCE